MCHSAQSEGYCIELELTNRYYLYELKNCVLAGWIFSFFPGKVASISYAPSPVHLREKFCTAHIVLHGTFYISI